MAQTQSIEGKVELKSHADKFYEVWVRKPYLTPNMCPTKHPKVELNEGDWFSVGSVQTWSYVLDDGERSYIQIKIKEIDENKRCVTYIMTEGEVLKAYYKTLKSKIQIIPTGDTCMVNWSIEVEKNNEEAPEPHKYLDFLLSSAKEIDAHLWKHY